MTFSVELQVRMFWKGDFVVFIIDHFSGPVRAIDRMRVYVSAQ